MRTYSGDFSASLRNDGGGEIKEEFRFSGGAAAAKPKLHSLNTFCGHSDQREESRHYQLFDSIMEVSK